MVRSSVFTVVGRISTPLYMDMNRGTTSIGNGSIANYIFVPGVVFDADYYTEIHLTVPGDHKIYSDSYNDFLEEEAERLEPLVAPYAQERFLAVKQEAEDAYQDGYKEYAQNIRDIADRVGIKIHQTHAPFVYPLDKWELSPSLMPILKRSIEISGILGAEVEVIHPYHHPEFLGHEDEIFEKNGNKIM
jgi:hypothetical protein